VFAIDVIYLQKLITKYFFRYQSTIRTLHTHILEIFYKVEQKRKWWYHYRVI